MILSGLQRSKSSMNTTTRTLSLGVSVLGLVTGPQQRAGQQHRNRNFCRRRNINSSAHTASTAAVRAHAHALPSQQQPGGSFRSQRHGQRPDATLWSLGRALVSSSLSIRRSLMTWSKGRAGQARQVRAGEAVVGRRGSCGQGRAGRRSNCGQASPRAGSRSCHRGP